MESALIYCNYNNNIFRLCRILLSAFSGIKITKVNSYDEVLTSCRLKTFSLILIDLCCHNSEDIFFISKLKPFISNSYIVIFTVIDKESYIINALRLGVNGYILKEQSNNDIVQLLRGIEFSVPPLSPRISMIILKYFSFSNASNFKSCLSSQETNVLTLIAKGYTRKEVSRLMKISINTVSAYMKSMYKKLNVNNCSEATLEAVKLGLVTIDGFNTRL